MIKSIKANDGGLYVRIEGDSDDIVTEFCLIVESLIREDVLDADTYLGCWGAVVERINEMEEK